VDRAFALGRGTVDAVRGHPWLSLGLALASLAVVLFGLYIGLEPPFTLFILVIVAVLSVLAFQWWTRRHPTARASRRAAGRVAFASVAAATAASIFLIQIVPYGRTHSNPPATGEPQWANDATRQLVVDACYACHSNEVTYPWYSNVAPFSWAVQHHIEEGREAVNYSEFATNPGEADESIEVILNGEMPPGYFTRFGLHPEARLTQAQIDELVAGLQATPGMSEGG
jgi:mono/diheme cytochrome c family protein